MKVRAKVRPLLAVLGLLVGACAVVAGIFLLLGLAAALIAGGGALSGFSLVVNA